ncbi:uncharacterized protein LOC117647094 isoform X2 [Thrips palmi]|nr:uncharacterized protein LOC117647094 isoform X2 [Thrips palmi]
MLNGTGPNGHSYVLAINEYCQRHFRADVRYVFARCDPDYSATAVLDGLTYATRKDPNKHVAKILAAKSTAEVLLPEMRDLAEDECLPDAYKLAVFDNVDLADERIPEITMPYDAVKPYKILLKCLARNFGYREADIQFTTHRPANQYCPARLALKVGSYSVTVPMTRFAKQEAAQTILMNVHPHLESWGSLIRMYIVNTARDFEDMTMLAGIQNVAMQPLDADIDDGLPPGEDKGEPRAAFRGGGVAGGVPADDSEDSDSEDDEDDDDEDDGDEDDEYDEEEHCCCREQCVLQVVHLSDSDEGEDLSDEEDDEDGEDGAKAEPERDANFNLCEERARCGGADRVDRPFFGRLSFGDLPAIGEDFEAGSLDPHRASAARTVTSSCATRPQLPAAAAEGAVAAPSEDAVEAADATGRGAVATQPRRRRGPCTAWFGGVEATERGAVQAAPLLWCDMPSSFADIFKDWPHRRNGAQGQQDEARDTGAVYSALFGLKIDAGKGESENGN